MSSRLAGTPDAVLPRYMFAIGRPLGIVERLRQTHRCQGASLRNHSGRLTIRPAFSGRPWSSLTKDHPAVRVENEMGDSRFANTFSGSPAAKGYAVQRPRLFHRCGGQRNRWKEAVGGKL